MRILDGIHPGKRKSEVETARKGVRAALQRLADALDEGVTGAAAGIARPPNGNANGGSGGGRSG